jgi:serine/threonine-protein kinase
MTRTDPQVRAVRGAHPWNTPQLPLRLGTWELVEHAADGSLAHIYRARPTEADSGQPPAYALKLLRPEWEERPEAVQLLAREAVVGRQVSHPHLVSVLAASVRRSPRYLVMPWLEGATLAEHLSEGQPVELPELLWIARQVAEALNGLHGHGWMHGDVKPENIMVAPDGHVTLLDLGFAKRQTEDASAIDRTIAGSCAYLAPELLTSRLRADIRSDLYSLGVVLFEGIVGHLPFAGRTLAELFTQHKERRAPDLKKLFPALPREVAALVNRLLAKEPLRRPQSPADLVAELAKLEISTFSERAMV